MDNASFDKHRFSLLLLKAIGTRTQLQFAKESGIRKETVSRYRNESIESVPSRQTIAKIAEASEGRVTRAELETACGYGAPEEKPAIITIDKCINEIVTGVDRMYHLGGKVRFYPSVSTYLDMVKLIYGGNAATYSVAKEIDLTKEEGWCPGKEELCFIIYGSMEPPLDGVIFRFALYGCQTIHGAYIFTRAVRTDEHMQTEGWRIMPSEDGEYSYRMSYAEGDVKELSILLQEYTRKIHDLGRLIHEAQTQEMNTGETGQTGLQKNP